MHLGIQIHNKRFKDLGIIYGKVLYIRPYFQEGINIKNMQWYWIVMLNMHLFSYW